MDSSAAAPKEVPQVGAKRKAQPGDSIVIHAMSMGEGSRKWFPEITAVVMTDGGVADSITLHIKPGPFDAHVDEEWFNWKGPGVPIAFKGYVCKRAWINIWCPPTEEDGIYSDEGLKLLKQVSSSGLEAHDAYTKLKWWLYEMYDRYPNIEVCIDGTDEVVWVADRLRLYADMAGFSYDSERKEHTVIDYTRRLDTLPSRVKALLNDYALQCYPDIHKSASGAGRNALLNWFLQIDAAAKEEDYQRKRVTIAEYVKSAEAVEETAGRHASNCGMGDVEEENPCMYAHSLRHEFKRSKN